MIVATYHPPTRSHEPMVHLLRHQRRWARTLCGKEPWQRHWARRRAWNARGRLCATCIHVRESPIPEYRR